MRVTVALLCIAFVLAGCTGAKAPVESLHGPEVTGITVPDNIADGESGEFIARFNGIAEPMSVRYTFTQGVIPLTVTHALPAGASEDRVTVEFVGSAVEETEVALTVRLSLDGIPGVSATGSFSIPKALHAPAIKDISITAPHHTQPRTLVVELTGTPGLLATVQLDTDYPMQIEPAGRSVTFDVNGAATANFEVTAVDLYDLPVSVDVVVDGPLPVGGHEQQEFSFAVPAFEPLPDTLYAIPLQGKVHTGEEAIIQVWTGTLPHPFLYMTGVRVCFPGEAGMEYEDYNINPGTPVGLTDAIDGIWEQVGVTEWPAPGGGFYSGSSFYPPEIWLEDGRHAIDFSLTPYSGHEVLNASGALFSFYVTFSNAGTWPITFQETNVVPRTYYQDENQSPDYFWGDISNDHPGVPNSITVVP